MKHEKDNHFSTLFQGSIPTSIQSTPSQTGTGTGYPSASTPTYIPGNENLIDWKIIGNIYICKCCIITANA